jgi:hypothetical protein
MKMAFIMLIAICLASVYKTQSHAQSDHVKAMWVWDFYASVSTQEQRNELIQFSLNNHINLLFIGSYQSLSEHSSDYAELIRIAHQKGIRVFALAGKASWALEENHQEVLDHIDQVLAYNSTHPSAQLDGLQLDIEPYILAGFWTHIDSIGLQFLQIVQKSVDLIKSSSSKDIEVNIAIPFWYATSKPPIIVTYKDTSKPLSQHILDMVDSVSIMAYRDNADAQIKVSKTDIAYAESINKKVYVGAETMPSFTDSIPDWITYHNKNIFYLNEQLELIEQYYKNLNAFGGIAIHTYDSFRHMQYREREIVEQKFNLLKSAGILAGYADGSAGFGNSATRAEIAVIAAKIGGYSDVTLYKPRSGSFHDVPHAAWSYGWVETAHRIGVMSGKGNRIFDPHSNITIEELLIVMAKSMGVSKVEGAVVHGTSVWAQEWVQAMINEGLIELRSNFTTNVTREELVNIVYEAYK